MKNKLYIIDTSEVFSGSIESSVTRTEKGDYVDCSGYLYNNNGDNLTFEQYKNLPEKKDKNLKLITDPELDLLIEQYKKDLCKNSKEEISEERYYELMECLPPLRYTSNGFLMCEFYYSNITNHVFKENNKFYTELTEVNNETR